jgi:hypothetical protein
VNSELETTFISSQQLAYTEGSAIEPSTGLSMQASGLLGECPGLPILLSDFERPVVKDLEPL